MDDELRKILAGMSSELAETNRNTSNAISLLKEHDKRIFQLESKISGKIPPTKPENGSVALVVEKVSEHENEIVNLTGQVIKLQADLKEVKELNENQNKTLNSIDKTLSGFFGNPKVIMTGRIIFAVLMFYAVAKGWIAK